MIINEAILSLLMVLKESVIMVLVFVLFKIIDINNNKV